MATLAQYLHSQFSSIQYVDFLLRLVIACVCGAMIGTERAKRLKEAGIRTHVIVCCAAALTMIISKYGFADLTNAAGTFFNGTRGADPARIAAQAVSGISFLGAGIIFKHGNTIKGLTTAAGIWATAVIGLTVGAGMYILGILSTAVIVLLQLLMHKYTVGTDSMVTTRLQFTVRDMPDFWDVFSDYLHMNRIVLAKSEITRETDGSISYDIVVRTPKAITMDHLAGFLEDHHNIEHAGCTPIF